MSNNPKPPLLKEQIELDRCPHCRVAHPTLEKKLEVETFSYDESVRRFWRVYRCTRCGGLVTAAARGWNFEVLEMYPSNMEADNSIPQKARDYLNQAMESLQIPAGAVMLAASAVDEMLRQKGFVEGKLYPRINAAKEAHLITNEMALWAHQVRLDANDQRHADPNANLPDEEDAKRSVDFAKALADFLFVFPSRVTRGIQETAPDTAGKASD